MTHDPGATRTRETDWTTTPALPAGGNKRSEYSGAAKSGVGLPHVRPSSELPPSHEFAPRRDDRVRVRALLWQLKRQPQTEVEARFFSKIAMGNGSCWEWVGSRTDRGYGQFRYEGRPMGAHRVSFFLFFGAEFAEGLDIDHLCRNRACVNPMHLDAVTHAENVRRGDRALPRPTPTHCKHGHSLSGDNVAPRSDGKGVRCRTCGRDACRRYSARRKA